MEDEARLESVRRQLTPDMMAAIDRRISSGKLPRAMLDGIARGGIDAVRRGTTPLESMAPIAVMEAIVRVTGRPPLLVKDDQVVLEPLPDFPPGTDVKIVAAQAWVPSVGRVEFVNADMTWGGTGWVIDARGKARIIATNRHVAKLVAKRLADGRGAFLRGASGVRMGASIDFREEAGSAAGATDRSATVTAIEYIADDLAADVALLRIETEGFKLPTPFALAEAEAKLGDLVALIGYPAFDPRNNQSDQARYFRDLYEVKRFAPGRIMQQLSDNTLLTHDCTSLGGNSGSPLIGLDSGKVVGLHFAGEYGIGNSAVGVTTLKKLLAGAVIAVAVPGGANAAVESAGDGHHVADFFRDRAGFATRFLGDGAVATPWPGIAAALAAGLAAPSDNPPEPHELRYTHFGVKYSAAAKLPLMTAVNIDGARAQRIKRANDKWFSDGRIDIAVQLGAKNYADVEIDRGHMVRREDPNWGDVAEAANFDTFHYVNAAPQHSRLNQGKQLWQGLENYILDSARTAGFRACVFTGPILGEDDEMIDGAHVPLEYWKLVATLDANGNALRATAYLLSQGQLIRDLLEKRRKTEAMEGVALGAYRTFQISVADLAAGTGHDFSAYLHADPLRRTDSSVESVESSEPRFMPLYNFSDVVL